MSVGQIIIGQMIKGQIIGGQMTQQNAGFETSSPGEEIRNSPAAVLFKQADRQGRIIYLLYICIICICIIFICI